MLRHTGAIKYYHGKGKESYRPTAVLEGPAIKQVKRFCNSANEATENALKWSLHMNCS